MRSTGLVFDVDGVLIDTSLSFPAAVSGAVRFCLRHFLDFQATVDLFTEDHYRQAKLHPGFNDDYDIAWIFLSWVASSGKILGTGPPPSITDWDSILALCGDDPPERAALLFGEVVDRAAVRKVCQEIYLGGSISRNLSGQPPTFIDCPGTWKNERPMLYSHWKELGYPVGIYTGRNDIEMGLALEILGWTDLPPQRCITADRGIRKPSAGGLFELERILSVERILFFGDTESDRKAFEGYGRGRFIAVGDILSGPLVVYPTLEEALLEVLSDQ